MDDDDLERMAGKTRTESAELRRRHSERSQRRWPRWMAAMSWRHGLLAAFAAAALAFVVLGGLR